MLVRRAVFPLTGNLRQTLPGLAQKLVKGLDGDYFDSFTKCLSRYAAKMTEETEALQKKFENFCFKQIAGFCKNTLESQLFKEYSKKYLFFLF